jgi:flavorubredoxin
LFGSYSWNGGGAKSLYRFQENVQWDLVSDPLDTKGIPDDKAFEKCEIIASAMVEKLKA